MRNFFRNNLVCALIASSIACTTPIAVAQSERWKDEQRDAIRLERLDPQRSAEMYRFALKDAIEANAPIEKQLALILSCGNLLYTNFRLKEAAELFSKGASLAQESKSNYWEARFWLMVSRNNHELVRLGLADTNDPAIAQRALSIRPEIQKIPTDFKVCCLQATGDAFVDNRDFASAERFYKTAISEAERIPDEQDRLNELIRSVIELRIKQGRYSEAYKLLTTFSDAQPAERAETWTCYTLALRRSDPYLGPIYSTVEHLLRTRAISQLEAYAAKLRQTSNQLPNGNLPIDIFYEAIAPSEFDSEAEWKLRIALIDDWIKQFPSSDTAKIASASLFVNYAWEARGVGWASSVTEEGWYQMKGRLDRAVKVLNQTQNRVPDWYPIAQRIALGQSWEKTHYDNIVRECRNKYPKYNTVLFSKAYWLLPRWFGKEGESNHFITTESNRLPGIAGDVLYAQFAWSLVRIWHAYLDTKFDWVRVKRGCREILRRYPNSIYARNKFYVLALEVGDKTTAESLFKDNHNYPAIVKFKPKEYYRLLASAKNHERHDERQEAIADYSKAIALVPSGGEAYYRRCEMYLMTNKMQEALTDINKCLSLYPYWSPALGKRGRIRNVLEQYSQSTADIEKSLEIDPENITVLSTLIHNYDAMGDHQRALNASTYDVEHSEERDISGLYYSYQDRGLVWINAHQYDQAVNDLLKGIQLKPTLSQLWAYLEYAYAATDRIGKAQETAVKQFARETYPPRGYRLRGEMYRAAGLWSAAIDDYSKSTTLEPTYGPGFWQRAVAEIALGKYEAAETDLKTSVALIPTSALSYSYLAFVETVLGKNDLSKLHIEKAFSLTPELPMNYVNRALIHLVNGDLEKSAADCQSALDRDKYLAEAYAASSLVLKTSGNEQDAARFKEKAKELWWHDWKVPLKVPTIANATSVTISMPLPAELKAELFSVTNLGKHLEAPSPSQSN